MANTNQLQLVFGDATLVIHAPHVDYLFSYERGGLESLRRSGKEWLYRVPTPTFGRATTDNDRGCGFPVKSAQWLGADMFSSCQHVSLKVDGRQLPTLNWSLPTRQLPPQPRPLMWPTTSKITVTAPSAPTTMGKRDCRNCQFSASGW